MTPAAASEEEPPCGQCRGRGVVDEIEDCGCCTSVRCRACAGTGRLLATEKVRRIVALRAEVAKARRAGIAPDLIRDVLDGR